MTTIAKVVQVESYVHRDNSFQVAVDCLALDSIGGVFDVDLNFTPKSIDARDKILEDLTVDSIFWLRGGYDVLLESIAFHDPSYTTVPPDYSEDEIREAFRVNSRAK